ncbi:MAG: [acyl-carrier-protein] S-malonyltransferase [Chloroflexi bacterium RBG_13_54_9]|nr:MAG: [acyl-carrier-protein] S-malonyltransferase [Chloroflexi bacterium RBG_13_54_9]
MIAYVFPGQGSQSVGMGRDLYDRSPAAKAIFEEADASLGFPLSRLCFEGPEEELRRTAYAQPAIVTVSSAYLKAMSQETGDPTPMFVAGHSLGEYTALVAAGVLSFSDTVRLAHERGRLMEEASERTPGGMAAIIGLDEETVEEVCRETGAKAANINSSQQIVISGTRETLAWAMDLARARGARQTIPLQVSGAFHSPLMQPAAEGLAKALARFTLRDPQIPIIANSTAQPVTTAAELQEELLWQLCHCVQWQRSVQYMVDEGVSTFIEIGPGRVLSGLIKRISKDAQVFDVSNVASLKGVDS